MVKYVFQNLKKKRVPGLGQPNSAKIQPGAGITGFNFEKFRVPGSKLPGQPGAKTGRVK